jgi:soluble lytic murein transglycosylase-like protein
VSVLTARGLKAAGLAAGAMVIALAMPRPLREPAWVPPEEGAAASEALSRPDAPRAGWRRFVEEQLRARAGGIEPRARARLAEVILEEAERARLDPVLVLAIIEVESGWDLDAESSRGARGLMQLRPATLRHEAARSGLFGEDPDDPALNVRAGVRYYRRLLDAFRREETALMAYNAGPARIGGYLRAGQIPDRFRAYPRRVWDEVARLKRALGTTAGPAMALGALEPRR